MIIGRKKEIDTFKKVYKSQTLIFAPSCKLLLLSGEGTELATVVLGYQNSPPRPEE